MRLWLLKSSQELSKALNRRMFYVLVRIFALVPTQFPDLKRQQIKNYFDKIQDGQAFVRKGFVMRRGKLKAQKHLFTLGNRIVNARLGAQGKKGLKGEAMRKATVALRNRAIGSVGYLRSVVAKAIRTYQGHFTQFGKSKRVKTESGMRVIVRYGGNAAFKEISKLYGGGGGNVAMHRGSRSFAYPARPGFRALATSAMNIGIADKHIGLAKFGNSYAQAESMYTRAINKALADETDEMRAHIEDVMDETAEQSVQEAKNGRAG